MNAASVTWAVVPMPGTPALSLPGLALLCSTSSLSVRASTFGLTTKMCGSLETRTIGVSSVSGSYGMLANMNLFSASEPAPAIRIV